MPIEKIDDTRERFTHPLLHPEIPMVNPIDFEVIKNRLNTIANEMGAAVHRAAHSLIFAEAKDFSCALFDHEGHMVGMGEFLPGHQGAMQNNLDGILAAVGWDSFGEGDILMSNDALYGASHPPDLVLFHPIYWRHELIGIAGCVVHHIDMGGTWPGSYYPLATELYQEGIRFPGTKLYEAGKLRSDILRLFLTNVRVPDTQHGDLMAQVGGCHLAATRLCELAEKYGSKLLKDTYVAIQHYAASRIRRLIEQMPDGVYVSEDYVDDDGHEDRSFKVKCTMTVHGDRLVFDFTGTEKQAKGYINCHWGNTAANCYSPVMSLDPTCPRCYGATSPIEIITEKGTLVNPSSTAPIMASTTEVGHAVHNVVWHCLSQAAPALGSGIWSGAFTTATLHGINPRTGKRIICMLSEVGGGGARQTLDGWPVASAKAPNMTLSNIEIQEAYWPVFFKYRRLVPEEGVPGSGGGTQRGGLGTEIEVSPLGVPLRFLTMANHFYHSVPGVFGGLPGHTAQIEIRDALTGRTIKKIRPKAVDYLLEPGQHTLYLRTPGGGGYGQPRGRDPEEVREDVLDGLVSHRTAKEIYGISPRGSDTGCSAGV